MDPYVRYRGRKTFTVSCIEFRRQSSIPRVSKEQPATLNNLSTGGGHWPNIGTQPSVTEVVQRQQIRIEEVRVSIESFKNVRSVLDTLGGDSTPFWDRDVSLRTRVSPSYRIGLTVYVLGDPEKLIGEAT
jgi:hypothetical protein